MRIISGIGRGLQLRTPPGRRTRPTLDRVREAIFSVIGEVQAASVVDLFAGSGALGLEALSRGAERVLLVENDRRAVRVLRDNLDHLMTSFSAAGVTLPEAEVVVCDAFTAPRKLARRAGQAEIVFADPPYGRDASESGSKGAEELLLDSELTGWMNGALLVLEHDWRARLPWYPATQWQCLKTRKFGDCAVSFARTG